MAEAGTVCLQCGTCCRVEGYVRIHDTEGIVIADSLGIDERYFLDEFTRLLPDRSGLGLTERCDGSCVFLQADNRCAIHEHKPRHCRDFPGQWQFKGYERLCAARRKHETESN